MHSHQLGENSIPTSFCLPLVPGHYALRTTRSHGHTGLATAKRGNKCGRRPIEYINCGVAGFEVHPDTTPLFLTSPKVVRLCETVCIETLRYFTYITILVVRHPRVPEPIFHRNILYTEVRSS